MRKPDTIEKLYLDFHGYFASVMLQAMPHLRDRPVGVTPVRDFRREFHVRDRLLAGGKESWLQERDAGIYTSQIAHDL